MNSTLIETKFLEYTVANGGHQKRAYLGMSQIARPESELLDELIHGTPKPNNDTLLRLALGYETEANVRARLEGAGLARPDSGRELVAGWSDGLFRGHTDGEWTDGSLLEIKSTVDSKLDRIQKAGRLPNDHFLQVQCYMHYGRYQQAFVIYFARDTGRVLVRRLTYTPSVGVLINQKAKAILRDFWQHNTPDSKLSTVDPF